MKDMGWRGCLVHRHGEVVDIERAFRGLRHGRFLLVTVDAWTRVLRMPRSTPRAPRTVAVALERCADGQWVGACRKNATCTEDSYSSGSKGTCSDSTCVCSLEEVPPDSGCDSQQRVFSSLVLPCWESLCVGPLYRDDRDTEQHNRRAWWAREPQTPGTCRKADKTYMLKT